ncbi:sphingomyelin phosphodiesterase-like isoform X2 [Sitophilus oryzae]|uniref:Sphingomyelin phosphodiesterase n=1 Tax=Sitophilus oryzae TaxID=7048 RepID=A0A6J2XFC1_SITOR|nr:sphingomyelin phosphodiesterase-like isoform X2 [Sitophilus oryzae]
MTSDDQYQYGKMNRPNNMDKLVFILLFIFPVLYGYPDKEEILREINKETKELLFADNIPRKLIDMVKGIKNIKDKTIRSEMVCRTCEQVIDNVIDLRKSEATKDVMVDYLNKLCRAYTDNSPDACKGYVNIDIDSVLFIIDHKKDFTPARFCAIRLQHYQCVDPDADPWTIPLPPPPSITNPSVHPVNGTKEMQVLHLTDIHYDPLYKPGSNAKCADPLCCDSGTPANPEDAAGFWGDYNVCDTPLHSIDDLFSRIKEKHNLDLIYFTGDIISHRSWSTSIQENREAIRLVLQYFAKTFPNTTVFPILGNHESHPSDYFSPEVTLTTNVTTEWIFDLVAQEWSKWLPNDTQSTIKHGGFYTALVRPGFRIVALNSNVCFTTNLWLLYQDKDPFDQLLWLVQVLALAEKNGEKVHLLSHVPPGEESCHKQWSNQFKKIILRFAKTITAQFNGHTHIDEFRLFLDNEEPVNVAYNGASFTTFVGYNPNYRIYQVDSSELTVTNYDHYIYNLTKANENSNVPPQWFKLYSFKDAYGLEDLSLKSLKSLFINMNTNNSDNALAEKYYRYRGRESDSYLKEKCDDNCKKTIICCITSVETSTTLNC